MARVTVEDCLEKVENRFALVHLASKRARQIRVDGADTFVKKENKECVMALREVAAGFIFFDEAAIEQLDKKRKRPKNWR